MTGSKRVPELIIACFCQEALIERDGNISVIRVLSKWTQCGPPLPIEEPVFTIAPRLVLGFASEIPASHSLTLSQIEPSGFINEEVQAGHVTFEAGSMLCYVSCEFPIAVRQQGIYWLEVRLDREYRTRVPLTISYEAEPPDPGRPLGGRFVTGAN